MTKEQKLYDSQGKARVEDYLNDMIQTGQDLRNLDAILQNLQRQQELQKKQLHEAKNILADATKASKEHSESVRKQVEAFKQQQQDLDNRLMIVTQSDTSEQAVKDFETSMERLHRLEIAKGYMGTLCEVDYLSKETVKLLATSPRLAVPPYTRLRTLSSGLKLAQPAAEGAASHLVAYASQIANILRDQMAKVFEDNLEKVLAKMKWPGNEFNVSDDLINEWTDAVELLLELQEPELENSACFSSSESAPGWEPPVLLPLEVMSRPLELRFKYHFSGDRSTNRLDKPEYFLSHVIDLIGTHSEFFAVHLQPILDKRAEFVDQNLRWAYADAVSSFINSLFPILRQKMSSVLPRISDHPQLLSHFIHELMSFDTEIRDVWDYSQNRYSSDSWKGLTWEALVKQGWFNHWLKAEKDFALSRYQDIIEGADSGEIDYYGVEPSATKPTKAAIRVNDLLETITERYRPLSSFSQKLRFLIDIQITIFDQFHERLRSGLEAYLAMTSTIGRTVQGPAGADASLEGVSGLERLCRVYGSAEYLERKMQDWSNDVFFLELWSELQERVKQNSHTGRPVAGCMSVSDVAARTSSVVANNEDGENPAEGALFDETASAYRRLKMRTESIIASTMVSSAQSALRAYTLISTWSSLSPPANTSGQLSHSSIELAIILRELPAEISFLHRLLAMAPLRRITRQVLLSIQTYIWDNVLMRNTFSASGASQLCCDVDNICEVVDVATGNGMESRNVMQKLVDGLFLLNLKIIPTQEDNNSSPGGGDETPDLSLWEAEKRLFANNESARSLLAELNFESLTESEARAVLERRVELRR
ncbi:RINT-1 family protein [Histoplasma capsulatum G186AR]|uniref:RINT-1 family protein n=1 Tax=Ajellomyces capsulatus TaxID=5037 RepID=A0A8H8CUK5_AJECA|nr:RINT-1 family protein [Histoplasma capsulatum]QSS68409.1 RINT-1 family protein [Histoplasma capsulatum G186AR]